MRLPVEVSTMSWMVVGTSINAYAPNSSQGSTFMMFKTLYFRLLSYPDCLPEYVYAARSTEYRAAIMHLFTGKVNLHLPKQHVVKATAAK